MKKNCLLDEAKLAQRAAFEKYRERLKLRRRRRRFTPQPTPQPRLERRTFVHARRRKERPRGDSLRSDVRRHPNDYPIQRNDNRQFRRRQYCPW